MNPEDFSRNSNAMSPPSGSQAAGLEALSRKANSASAQVTPPAPQKMEAVTEKFEEAEVMIEEKSVPARKPMNTNIETLPKETENKAEEFDAKSVNSRVGESLFPDLKSGTPSDPANEIKNFEALADVLMDVTVELGRTQYPIKQILQLTQGSVIELDGMVGDTMNVLVNGKLFGSGEVVVVNDRFGIRLTAIHRVTERSPR